MDCDTFITLHFCSNLCQFVVDGYPFARTLCYEVIMPASPGLQALKRKTMIFSFTLQLAIIGLPKIDLFLAEATTAAVL